MTGEREGGGEVGATLDGKEFEGGIPPWNDGLSVFSRAHPSTTVELSFVNKHSGSRLSCSGPTPQAAKICMWPGHRTLSTGGTRNRAGGVAQRDGCSATVG